MADSTLKRGIEAAKAGQIEKARVLLARAVRTEPDNEQAWLWLAGVVDGEWEKLYCLRQAQRVNPTNQTVVRAVRALRWHLDSAGAIRQAKAGEGEGMSVATPDPVAATAVASVREEECERAPSPRRNALTIGLAFLAQRLLFGALILAVISFLSYLGLEMAEGVPLGKAFADAAWKTASYAARLARGDLGTSVAGSVTYAPVPVADVLPGILGRSLGLLAISLAFATLIGVLLGIWAARHRHTGWSVVMLLASVTGVSVPSFFAALLLQLLVIRWTRSVGRPLLPVGGFGWDKRLVLPALVLAARPIAQIARITFVSLGGVLDHDYVRTAHSKGLSSRLVMGRHVLRNAAIPILTTIGVSLRYSLSSLPVVEFFFNWTGMGFMLLKAIARRDDNMSVALVLCLGALFILVNLALESVYRLIDPRLRQRVTRAEQRERENLLQVLQSAFVGAVDWFAHTRLLRWLLGRATSSEPSPFREVLEQRGITVDVRAQEHVVERRRAWLRGTLGNVSFVLGAVIVAMLVVMVLLGPSLTPYSPYTTRGLEYSDGKLTVPPFAPDATYLWGTDAMGRDIFSLVIAGAQQTLLLVVLVVAARMLLGFVLGSLAGWLNGSWVDRSLLALSEIVSAFPTLLLSMTLILALGIRQGMRPFVLALSFVGWGEIMQFVRGEVMSVRVKPFIESAVATGLRTPRVIWSHVLPNLLPALISIAALEMGAVLMLLGELGFVGIFVGGGAFAELHIDAPPYHYSDVPEWGALLSNVRLYARAYPWTAVYPTLAFFVSILGFNLFGEGIRRMIETVGIGLTRLVNRYTVTAAVIAVVGIAWARGYTGSMAYYRRQAASFSGLQAMSYLEALSDPAFEGRALGTEGYAAAGDYIARMFESVGLQSGGEDLGYFQTQERSFELLDGVPKLSIVGDDRTWTYRKDYAEYPTQARNLGAFRGRVRALAMGELTLVRTSYAGSSLRAFVDMDMTGDVIMLLSERDAAYLQWIGVDGALVVAEDERDIQRRDTLSSKSPLWRVYGTGRAQGRDTPVLWIDKAVADRLLQGTGHTVDDLRREAALLGQDQVREWKTDTTVEIEIQGSIVEKAPARHVIGQLPGESDSRYGGINAQTIVVLAQYDNPPPSPDGELYPGANDNASGVAVMAEVARTMRETGYQPYRTFLFIAYSGEGLVGGEPVSPSDVRKFLQARPGFSSNLDIEAIVHLRGLGSETGQKLALAANGSRRLLSLFEASARWMGVQTTPGSETVDISIVFEDKSRRERGQDAPELTMSWEGWEERARMPADTPDAISVEQLERAGRVLTLALMTMGREIDY